MVKDIIEWDRLARKERAAKVLFLPVKATGMTWANYKSSSELLLTGLVRIIKLRVPNVGLLAFGFFMQAFSILSYVVKARFLSIIYFLPQP